MEDLYQFDEEFRDSIGTVDAEGKRIWVYPKKPKGNLHNKRTIVTIVLLALFFSGPFIKIGGQPLLLLNLFERRFVIFGQAFWPQDFVLLAITGITFFVFVILFTVVFGRVWCGWACPQTLFLEMVFRKIEYIIEGDANQQRKLDKAPWDSTKIMKKAAKHFVFILISVIIAHTAMAYLVGIDMVKELVTHSPAENMAGFIGLLAFTGVFYGVFSYFREQACVVVCPYGRLQGVLLDKKSIVVAYDWLRGEPRGKLKKNETQKQDDKGDCIDCKLCVHACPTGIDIRNGTQLECVNCTACIDACDEVMLKVDKPKGLIRYSSYDAIKTGDKKIMNPRVAGYSVVLMVLMSVLFYMVSSRSDVEATIMKIPGTLYQKSEDGQITNLYNIRLVNKTFDQINLSMSVEGMEDVTISQVGGEHLEIRPNEMYEGVFFVKVPGENLESAKNTFTIKFYNDNELIEKKEVRFLAPLKIKR